jgi:hypothetical protein
MKYVAKQDLGVADLYVSYANGPKHELRLSKGQVIPVELLDENDIKKSLAFGSLGGLIRTGYILEVEDANVADVVKAINSNMKPAELEKVRYGAQKTEEKYKSVSTMSQEEFATKRDADGMVNNIDMKDNGRALDVENLKFSDAAVTERSGGLVVTAAETVAVDGEVRDAVVNEKNGKATTLSLNDYKPSTDLSKVSTRDDFEKLNHFDQLLFVRQCSDKTLLTDIVEKTTKKQIQNNARKRVEEIK